MASTRTPLRRKTIIGWMLACIAVTGLLGYEWMPEHLRGGWVLYLLLVASGAVLRVGQALVLGLVAFAATALYVFYRTTMGLPIQQQVLLLVLNAAAPLWLSAIYHNLALRRGASKTLVQWLQRSRSMLNLAASEPFERQFRALCRQAGLAGYRVLDITIDNHGLIVELLGEQVWQATRLRMLEILERHADGWFIFADEALTQLRCFQAGDTLPDSADPEFLERLRAIRELILQVHVQVHAFQDMQEAQP